MSILLDLFKYFIEKNINYIIKKTGVKTFFLKNLYLFIKKTGVSSYNKKIMIKSPPTKQV